MVRSQKILAAGTVATLLCLAAGCGPKAARVTAGESLDKFITEAQREPAVDRSEGSLWVDHGRYSNLYRDFKAREINDMVTIRVFETTRAVSGADAESSRQSSMDAKVPNLLGLENAIKELPNLVGATSDSSFKGEATTSRNTSVSTTMTARVTNVLPNGYLVVEAVKEIQVNDENQTLYLRGVVRPEDISPGNIVASSDVGQMELRVQGRGMVSQPLNPGWLYRILLGVLPF